MKFEWDASGALLLARIFQFAPKTRSKTKLFTNSKNFASGGHKLSRSCECHNECDNNGELALILILGS